MDEEILTLTREQLGELKKRFLHANKAQEQSRVRVSKDQMEAWLYLEEPSEQKGHYRTEELLDILRDEGVTTGYLMPRLVAMAKKGVYYREILVARGKEVVEGKDGFYEYFFMADDVKTGPVIREDGSVDYGSMNILQSVKEGDALAEYHPAEAGADGYSVRGVALKCRQVKELQPLRGMSIERRDNTYYAKVAGKIELKNGSIDIRTVHEIPGDVDLSTGRVEFFGDVTIGGSVSAGVVIRAGRNLVIEGTVESAELFAGGDIVLTRGVQGNLKGKIRSRGSIYANFIEQCDVHADVNIEANYILNANVRAGSRVVVNGKKGSIIGGKTFALKEISAYNLGNIAEVRTVIHAGYEQEVYDRFSASVEQEKEYKEKLADVVERMETIIKNKQFKTESGNKNLVILNGRKDEYYKKLDDLKVEIKRYQDIMDQGRGAKIHAEGNTFKGVLLSIMGFSRQVASDLQYATYRCVQGEIVSEPFQGVSTEEA